MLETIFCIADDFCKEFNKTKKHYLINEDFTKKRYKHNKLSDSEIITILIFFHYSKFKTFKDYYELAIRGYLRSAFRDLVSYNRFLELAQNYILTVFVFSNAFNGRKDGTIYFKVCHNKRTSSNKVFRKIAKKGKTSMGWFFGFKLHFVINHFGEIVEFILTPGNVSDKNQVVIDFLTRNIKGKLFGDKGYISGKLFKKLFEKGIQIITKIRKNMKNCFVGLADKLLLKKRGVIESVGNILKNFHQIEHSRHRSFEGFLLNVFSAISAYHLRPNKPSINSKNLKLAAS